jgi:putative endopeptidase
MRVSLLLLLLPAAALADEFPPAPELNLFDPSIVDRSVDPCDDFFKFTCSKWLVAHPIPSDQASWGTGSNLRLRNETTLREAMIQASVASAQRSPEEQRTGDCWAACWGRCRTIRTRP